MKKLVIDLLQQRELTHIFNEKDYNHYKSKVTRGIRDYNEYSAAFLIMDMFIVNTPVC
jgi:hypothetical protein